MGPGKKGESPGACVQVAPELSHNKMKTKYSIPRREPFDKGVGAWRTARSG